MHLSSLIEMVESGLADRELLGERDDRLTGGDIGRLARSGAARIGAASAVVYAGENHPLLPIALLSAAWAGVPFVPVNFRLDDRQLNELVARQPGALVLADASTARRLVEGPSVRVFDDWLDSLGTTTPDGADDAPLHHDDDDVAVVLFTSGTTSAPKSALLRHRHLMAYLLGSVEFAGAAEDDAVLVAVPPYHIAGLANMLSNLFAGRRLAYLRAFDPVAWLETVRTESITNAMVVPTMLSRIVEALDGRSADVPSLRTLSYGGAKVPERVLRAALELFPDTGFVNAYGLTETASTIAVLGPEDHRAAVSSGDEAVRRRLSSAGQVLPTIELEVRGEGGESLGAETVGLIHVRGEQISGEYATGSVLDSEGWFCTRDRGWVDADGYLFIEGRADDTIIRGGENIAPAEIEEVLLGHPAIAEVCVVGVPDDEWGQRIVAAVVLRPGADAAEDDLREVVRGALRGSKTPERILFVEQLPHTDTGKLLRRNVVDQLAALSSAALRRE